MTFPDLGLSPEVLKAVGEAGYVEPTPIQAKAQRKETENLVEHLMGRKPELRFAFIQENAKFVSELDV